MTSFFACRKPLSFIATLLLVVAAIIGVTSGFSTLPDASSSSRIASTTTALFAATNNDNDKAITSRRRGLLQHSLLVLTTAVTTSLLPSSADATYSAYTHREEDWTTRNKDGSVRYSTAKSLRSQLRDMVPNNDDTRSKVFCPNGPSAAVSPLMENKCADQGDRGLALYPSVYGRTDDVVGNSIPGVRASSTIMSNNNGKDSMNSGLTQQVGGFPKY